jgi:hypothetical protein
MRVVFMQPEDGSEIVGPEIDWLRKLVLHGGADFWCSGSGQGWLRHSAGSELLLAFKAGLGFYLEYIDSHHQYWITISMERRDGNKIPIWIGGDPIIVSEQFFVSAELACVIVEEFCVSGQQTGMVSWTRRRDVEWNYGYWDHPDVKFQ